MDAPRPNNIYVDARALQDDGYRFRGVGQHSVALLHALRGYAWPGQRPRLIAVIDAGMGPLAPAHELLFDQIATLKRARPSRTRDWFLSLSPMTHDPMMMEGFLRDPSLYRICLFYDLIPLEYPERYLASAAARSAYLLSLAWLRCFDAFAAISAYSAQAVIERAGVDRAKVYVSNVAVRRQLEPRAGFTPVPFAERRDILVSGGGDARKNPDCALVAHARSAVLRKLGVKVGIFGSYPEAMRDELRVLYRDAGGRPQDLVFHAHLTDAELQDLYRSSLVTVVPSRAEGFSIPIVESSAAGTPVLASDVAAHPELARDAAWRFDPDDPKTLRRQIEALATQPQTWSGLRDAQIDLWRDYTVTAVGERFMNGVLARAPKATSRLSSGPAVGRGAKPRIAVLSPLPPARSGVSDYTSISLKPLKDVAELHMFTPTPNARWEPGWASLQPVEAAFTMAANFDATISVVGNSDHHTEIVDYLLEHGGGCIAHDARMINFYAVLKGMNRAAVLAGEELGRTVDEAEVSGWLQNQHNLPTLFLSEIARASHPLMVHSPTTANEIERLYGKTPKLLPFVQYRNALLARVTKVERERVRKALGVPAKRVLLATFGIVSEDKAPLEIIWALRLLRNWGVDAELAFCGNDEYFRGPIRALLKELDLEAHVRTFDKDIDEATYTDYLIAADIGVQLRTYKMGGLSGALNDCISAALPSIANAHLAEAMLAPGFVKRIPDGLSSLLIAEAALEIISEGRVDRRPVAEAKAVIEARSAEQYCDQLLKHLELEVATVPASRRRGR